MARNLGTSAISPPVRGRLEAYLGEGPMYAPSLPAIATMEL